MKRKLKHQGICQDRERQSSINHLPDEVILEIFDFYRRGIDPYEWWTLWREKHAWIRLTHICRKWRAIVFASSFRLDLGITIRPWKPSHIKTILSGSWPIFINYVHIHEGVNIGSAVWRLRAALKHRDRVREISFEFFQGMSAEFDNFFEETQCAFPILESLSLFFNRDYHPKLPDTLLGEPDSYNLHLRRLKLEDTTLESISEFILSTTALTDLSLQIDAAVSPSAEVTLLSCLQGMPCLRSLDLSLAHKSPSQPPIPKDIAQLSELTYFHFFELDALVAGLSAPSLQDVDFRFYDEICSPNLHLRRFNDEIEKHYYAVFMPFNQNNLRPSLFTHSEYNDNVWDEPYWHEWPERDPRFNFGPVWNHHPESIVRMSNVISTMLSTVEELHVLMCPTYVKFWEDLIPWRRLLRSFSSIKVIRIKGENSYFGRTLSEESDAVLGFMPALKEIKLYKNRLDTGKCEAELATFQPFVNARQKAGFPVNVFFGDKFADELK